jgi:hypothetical protein
MKKNMGTADRDHCSVFCRSDHGNGRYHPGHPCGASPGHEHYRRLPGLLAVWCIDVKKDLKEEDIRCAVP